jgi:DHA1 family bicyclomycin/chloramphenicol resistance-like MFS transporter
MSNSNLTSARSQGLTVLLLALLLGLQPITTDLYLPALPALTQGFGASMVQAQLTLTALLLAFGTSQLVWGPLSDKWGRRPVLLGGIAVYTASAIACALAPDIETLIVGRTLQGVAMGACVMAARAIVRDLYEPVQGAKIMSQALSGLGLIACTCVPVGGFLTDLLGWRWALSSLVLFAVLTGLLIYFYFDESLLQKNPNALQAKTLWTSVKHIVRNPTFQAYSALSTASFAGLFTFLATSAFVFTQSMALSKTMYGLLMFSMSLSYIVGTFGCRWLLLRISVQTCVVMASFVSLFAGVLLMLVAYFGPGQAWFGAWAVMVPVNFFLLAHGVHQPCGQSGCIAPFPEMAGTASALNGFSMMLVAFGMGTWIGTHMTDPLLAMANGIMLWSACVALIGSFAVRKIPVLKKKPEAQVAPTAPVAPSP